MQVPPDDYVDRVLDLNDLVVKNPAATYFVRARGDSMRGAGIHDGDVPVVDQSRGVESGDVVGAAVDGELMVKRAKIKTSPARRSRGRSTGSAHGPAWRRSAGPTAPLHLTQDTLGPYT